MPNFYYYDANGQKKGAYTPEQLKELVLQGIVNPKTPLETEGGHKGLAGQIPGLFPAPSQTPKPLVGEEALMNMVQEEVKQPARTTPKYFFTDANGLKHLLDDLQLKTWAAQGVITPKTPLETESGQKGLAGQIPGLFATTPPPVPQPAQMAPPFQSPSGLFCTNCGNPVHEHAAACMSCGAKPVGHKRFCRHCAAALNPEQVICVRCGAGISATGASRSVGGGYTGTTSPKSKLTAGLLALFLGGLGVHKFYMGSWGWGLVYLLLCWTYIPALIALVEGIMYLVQSKDAFAEKYPPETQAPFRW